MDHAAIKRESLVALTVLVKCVPPPKKKKKRNIEVERQPLAGFGILGKGKCDHIQIKLGGDAMASRSIPIRPGDGGLRSKESIMGRLTKKFHDLFLFCHYNRNYTLVTQWVGGICCKFILERSHGNSKTRDDTQMKLEAQ